MSLLRYQPQGVVKLSPLHPLVRNVVGAFLPTSRTEVVSGAAYGTLSGYPALVGSPVGLGWSGTGSVTLPKAMSPQFGPAQITVIVVMQRFGNYSQYARVADDGGDTTSAGGWDIEASANGGLNFTAWNGATPTNGTSVPLPLNTPCVLAYSNNGAVTRSYLNGAFMGQVNAAMSPATTGGAGPVTIGASRSSGASPNVASIMGLIVVNKFMSDAEIQRFASQPSNVWAMFSEGSNSSAYQSSVIASSVAPANNTVLTWTEADDTSVLTVRGTNRAALASTDADDASTITVIAANRVALASIDADDTSALTATANNRAILIWTDANDISAVTVLATDRAALAWTEADDLSQIQVTVAGAAPAPTNVALAWTDADDISSLAIRATDRAALAWADANDISAISISARNRAVLGWTDANDISNLTVNQANPGGVGDAALVPLSRRAIFLSTSRVVKFTATSRTARFLT